MRSSIFQGAAAGVHLLAVLQLGAQSLPVPPLAPAGTELRIAEGVWFFDPLRPASASTTIGVNGAYLGPTLVWRSGERASHRIVNALGEPTTLHWHGALVPGAMDGGPHHPIAPGTVFTSDVLVNQPPATLWYHAHPHRRTAEQVYRGLAGLLLVDPQSPGPGNTPLPNTYGVDDFVLLVQDKRLTPSGALEYAPAPMEIMHGYRGPRLYVNGRYQPRAELPSGWVRLRLANVSNAGIYTFRLLSGADGKPARFWHIAGDGGFLPRPVVTDYVVLSTGERAEILVDTRTLGSTAVLAADSYLAGENLTVLRLQVGTETSRLTRFLPWNASIPTISTSGLPRRHFELTTMGGGSTLQINGRSYNHHLVDFQVQRGKEEIWVIRNRGRGIMGMPHNFHVHGTQFRVLGINGRPPPPQLAGLKDTLLLWEEERAEILVRFDHPGTYMYHCHFLEHEDAGMMGQFTVE